MFTIKAISEKTGKAYPDINLSVQFDGFRGGTAWQYTDSQGEAHFDHNNGTGSVYTKIAGYQAKLVYSGNISGRIIVYI